MEMNVINMFIAALAALLSVRLFFLSGEKKQYRKLIEKKTRVFEKVFDVSTDAILILSENNKILYSNKAMVGILGLTDGFLFKNLHPIPKVKIDKELKPLDALLKTLHTVSEEKVHSFSGVNLLPAGHKGRSVPVNLYIENFSEKNRYGKWHTIILMHDLRNDEKNTMAAYRHKLTGLPNQSQALMDMNALYAKIHLDKNMMLALVLIDIDNIPQLRAIIGYEQVNEILKKFANYLTILGKKYNFSAYHTFHNEFLLICPKVESSDKVIGLSEEVQKELASFYKMEDARLHLTASVGISIYPESGSTLNLFDNAYKALAQAKKSGHGRVSLFKEEMLQHDYDELVLYNEMHQALEKNEFEVYYQPIVDVKNREVVSAEALIRWRHPKYGLIAPDVFIPMMEKTGFIVDIGRFVLEEVLKQLKRWELFKFRQINVSINMSLLEIETEGFIENVERQLIHHKVNPELIKFEITEGSAMRNSEKLDNEFLALKNLGVGISLDDFGTGYTSFSYLKKFPADILKIDKTMIDYILVNKEDQRIIKAMIELGHNLGMKIVVEGIENEKMFDLISSYECDYMQGYYFSKPVPVFEFQKLLRK